MTKVRVEQGWLEGEILSTVVTDKPYYSFKGIPYAAPPVGKLRFKAPQPHPGWEGVKKATEHGPNCPQFDIFTQKLIEGSEDCLYLNVYSSNLTPETPRPVMIFIHGGGYKSGSGNDDLYGPDFLVEHDVILVTINYRLEVLGFLCLDTADVPGNAGMKDQSFALKWVHKNISNFGGDPHNITVFGESAGGCSTSLHVLSPMSKGLFKQAIIMSGVPFCDWTMPFHPQKRAFLLGKQLGLTTEDPKELFDFLQSVPCEKLINTDPCIISIEQAINNPLKMYHFTPVKEKDFGQEAFLLESPVDYVQKGKVNDVKLMFGYTKDEAILSYFVYGPEVYSKYQYEDVFAPRKMLYYCKQNKFMDIWKEIKKHYFTHPLGIENPDNFIKYLTDVIFIYDILKYFKLFKKHNSNKCYMYKFSALSELNFFGNLPKLGIKGVSHLDDILYLFHAKKLNLQINKEKKSYEMIQQTCKLFTNFAKYGNPTPDPSMGVIWQEYGKSENYLSIGEQLIPGDNPDADVIEFWDKIYKMDDGSYYEDYNNWN